MQRGPLGRTLRAPCPAGSVMPSYGVTDGEPECTPGRPISHLGRMWEEPGRTRRLIPSLKSQISVLIAASSRHHGQ